MAKQILRIAEAIERAKAKGIKINKKKLAMKIWTDTTDTIAGLSMTHLCKGDTQRICPEWVNIICKECDCDPNYLFGYEKQPEEAPKQDNP